MIPENELKKIIEMAKKCGVGKLYLSGSSLSKSTEQVRDYDFAVGDVPQGEFFKFYGKFFLRRACL
ncbi:MAG: hypothetical protein M1491_00240 [Deltaproteobacteria bacterium]|nr:hypothetical protein [Deltaproteobacteria bacterium]